MQIHSPTATDKWVESLDNGENVDDIYMDFQKAFDKVPHKCLLTKMRSYGLGGETQDWVKAFILIENKHKMCVNGVSSSRAHIIIGITQGTVLGPVLFVPYINNLPDAVDNEVYLFADNTKIFSEVSSIADSTSLQTDLDNV